MRDGTGSQTQKGIVHYGLSANRQRPLAGTLNAAIFNTWRRFSHQVLFIAPPMVIAYYTMQWAIERFAPFLLRPSSSSGELLMDT